MKSWFPCENGCGHQVGLEIPCYVHDPSIDTALQCLITDDAIPTCHAGPEDQRVNKYLGWKYKSLCLNFYSDYGAGIEPRPFCFQNSAGWLVQCIFGFPTCACWPSQHVLGLTTMYFDSLACIWAHHVHVYHVRLSKSEMKYLAVFDWQAALWLVLVNGYQRSVLLVFSVYLYMSAGVR